MIKKYFNLALMCLFCAGYLYVGLGTFLGRTGLFARTKSIDQVA